jgi:glutaredoxin
LVAQKTLEKFTGQRTVPNVFVNGTHVGGASDVENYHESGLLDHLMEDTSTHKAE